MFEIAVKGHFDAAHYLKGYQGKCEEVHGHRFGVVVEVRGEKLNDIGILYDFADLKHRLRDILDGLDHHLLNDLTPFKEGNPSSENIASYIYQQMADKLRDEGIHLSYVEVWESPENGVRFTPGR